MKPQEYEEYLAELPYQHLINKAPAWIKISTLCRVSHLTPVQIIYLAEYDNLSIDHNQVYVSRAWLSKLANLYEVKQLLTQQPIQIRSNHPFWIMPTLFEQILK